MTGRQATNRDYPLPDERVRMRPPAKRTWARRGASVLVLGALTLAVLTAVQALGGPGIAAQPALAEGLGNCLPKTETKLEEPGNDVVLNASADQLITKVSIKAGTKCFVTPEGTFGTFGFDECYVIGGLATAQVTVRRIGSGPGCKDISNIQYATAAAGELSLCKVAGSGVAVGESFGFTVREAAIEVTAGSCASAGTFPAGVEVSVAEAVPAGVEVASIVCAANATCSNADLAGGTVSVTIGAGENEVTYTNQRTAGERLTICPDAHNYGAPLITELTFTVGQTTVVIPVDGLALFPDSVCLVFGIIPIPGVLVGTFPVGTQVTITEAVPEIIRSPENPETSGNFFQIICTDSATCSDFDQREFCARPDFFPGSTCHAGLDEITGTVTVTIGGGENGVLFFQGRGD